MRIGAYQFSVGYDIGENCAHIARGAQIAAGKGARLAIFPECALTGYPTGERRAADIDFPRAEAAFAELRALSDRLGIALLVGSATRHGAAIRNSAALFLPGVAEPRLYHKRALWGWDARNFSAGAEDGIWTIAGLRVGVRICFEVRFPEYFRELYRARADVMLVLFHDVSDEADPARSSGRIF